MIRFAHGRHDAGQYIRKLHRFITRGDGVKIVRYLISIIVFLSLTGLCYAKAGGGVSGDKPAKASYDITSDSLEATKGEIVFTGNVKIVYGDTEIYADRTSMLYESDDSGSAANAAGNISTVVATGNVRLIQQKREARADTLVFVRDTGVVTLTGSPKIIQDNNTIAGEEITLFLNDDKVKIKGGVKALINPDTINTDLSRE